MFGWSLSRNTPTDQVFFGCRRRVCTFSVEAFYTKLTLNSCLLGQISRLLRGIVVDDMFEGAHYGYCLFLGYPPRWHPFFPLEMLLVSAI